MEHLSDSFLLFGRASLGATIGFALGWLTQGDRHSRWVVILLLLGYGAGAAFMWPERMAIVAVLVMLLPAAIGAFSGMVLAASTLGDREDWYIRLLGFAGFLVTFHAVAIGAAAAVNAFSES